MGYLTVAEYRTYMGALTQGTPTYDDPGDSAFHQQLLDSATALIEAETGRRFAAATETRKYDASAVVYGDPQLLMLDGDLLTVTTLTNGDGAVIPSNGYTLWSPNRTPYFGIRLKTAYAWAFSNADSMITVAGTWGYTATPSADVKRVCARLAYLEQQRRTNTGEVLVLQDGFTYNAPIPGDVAQWLTRYRRWRMQ